MPDDDAKNYEQARKTTEKALDAYVNDEKDKGDALVDEAKALNETAVRDVSAELEEDAGSEHDPKKIADRNG